MTEGFVAFLASLAAGLLSALGLGGGGILVLYLTLVQGMDPGWRDCWTGCGFPKHLPSWCF